MSRTLVLALLLAACSGGKEQAGEVSEAVRPFEAHKGTLDIAGGTAHIPVMKEAQRRIMGAHPDIKITVAGGGSGVGVQKVGEGLVQIGNTGRPLSEEEAKKHGLRSFAFAIDGVAVAVHPRNPVRDLTTRQVKEIFEGRIANWRDVGGKDAPINLYVRDEASGTRKVFWKECLEKGPVAKNANVVSSNGAMKTAIANDEGAVGYVSIGHVDDSIQSVKLDGVKPSQESAASGKYKVTRKLFMNTKGEPAGLVAEFIRYILSGEGSEIVRDSGYIPIQG
ncbi:MAG: phosphate ABC transporter substrate-binding protein [Planctomycetota bacterium]|jgi:phosphate transport system substrate-binding protein